MTISFTDIISIRPWRGYDDPGLPSATWISHLGVTGNLSGGQMQTIHVFKPILQGTSGRYFNIEQIDANFTLSATTNAGMFTLNFDRAGGSAVGTRQWRFETQGTGDSFGALHYQQGLPPMPLFLGQTTRLVGQQTSLTIGMNNVDGEGFSSTIQGYVWEPRSVQAPGGLRRPLDGLYGR